MEAFKEHLQTLRRPNIKWTVTSAKEAAYLDIRLRINEEGYIETDIGCQIWAQFLKG